MRFPDCKIHRMPQRSPEWHEIRKGKMTATGMGSWLTERPECRYTVAELRQQIQELVGQAPPAKLKRDELIAECVTLGINLPKSLLKATEDSRLNALAKLVGSLSKCGQKEQWTFDLGGKPPKVGRKWTWWMRLLRFSKRVFEMAYNKEVPNIKEVMKMIRSGVIDEIDEAKRPVARTAYAIWRGIEMESEAMARFTKDTGFELEEVGFCEHHSGMSGCSPDGLIVGQNVGFEGKVPHPDTHAKYLLRNELPPEYRDQVHSSMAVTGADAWWFQSYCPGAIKEVFRIKVERDEYTEAMETGLNEFAEFAKQQINQLLK